jgi:transcriptional regulator with XRE-family HTH domain
LAHAIIKTEITPEWLRAIPDSDDGIYSVGGLAHRLGMLKRRAKPSRLALAKFFEFARRERNQSPQELAASAGVDVQEVLDLERIEWRNPDAQVITLVAKALEADPKPLLELAGLSHNVDDHLVKIANQFVERLSIKPLEPQEREALSWLRSEAFKSAPAPAKAGADHVGT